MGIVEMMTNLLRLEVRDARIGEGDQVRSKLAALSADLQKPSAADTGTDSSFTDPIKFPSDCETKTILFKYLISAP